MERMILTQEEIDALIDANLYYTTDFDDVVAPNLEYCREDAPVFAWRDDQWIQIAGKAKGD